jgi:hypothetical protein
MGFTGPDLGYGLKLAHRLEPRLQTVPGESREDALMGGFACGSRRSATFGRAPVIHDMEWAYTLWGYLGGAPQDLLDFRVPLFRGAGDDYWQQRRIADAVRPDALRLTPSQVRESLDSWKELVIP